MTRKHFRILADGFKRSKPKQDPPITDSRDWNIYTSALDQWKLDVRLVMDVCYMTNSLFSYETFKEACGWYE
jgi:hypothetical protein